MRRNRVYYEHKGAGPQPSPLHMIPPHTKAIPQNNRAVDVDEEGRLVVRTDSGEEHVFTGEVSVRGIYGSL